jgi:hypothetical protein
MKPKAKKTRKVGRNAESGKFIPVKTAQRKKATSVVETVPTGKKARKSK